MLSLFDQAMGQTMQVRLICMSQRNPDDPITLYFAWDHPEVAADESIVFVVRLAWWYTAHNYDDSIPEPPTWWAEQFDRHHR